MYVVTSLGFVLLLSLVTGLLAYKKFWRGLLRIPRWNRGARTLMGDLHRLAGLCKRTKLALEVGHGVLDCLGKWKWPSIVLITVVPLFSFAFW